MSQLVQIAQTVASFIVVLGILVFVHEFGHFIVAKAFKIAVPVFSLGFGKRLWGFRRQETDYRVSLIPLGGYVRLAGDEADETRTGAPEEFLSRPRWQRFLVFVAGATFNIVLAVLVLTVVFATWGRDELVRPETFPTVADVLPESTAHAAGIRAGDKILRIAGKDARDEQTEMDEISLAPGQTKTVEFERNGTAMTVSMETGQDPKYRLGFPGWRLVQEGGPPQVVTVIGGTPAAEAGLVRGDKVVGIDGHSPRGETALRALIEKSAGREVKLEIERDEKTLEIAVTPQDDGNGRGKIGVMFSDGYRVHRKLTLGSAFAASIDQNIYITKSVFKVLGGLLRLEISPRALSGPIEIARVSREAVRGAETFLTFLAFISLQLGILNLLPIPVLDGGHILILGFEAVIRRDMSEKLKERVLTAGFVVLVAFFGMVLVLDVLKLRN